MTGMGEPVWHSNLKLWNKAQCDFFIFFSYFFKKPIAFHLLGRLLLFLWNSLWRQIGPANVVEGSQRNQQQCWQSKSPPPLAQCLCAPSPPPASAAESVALSAPLCNLVWWKNQNNHSFCRQCTCFSNGITAFTYIMKELLHPLHLNYRLSFPWSSYLTV